MKLVNNNISPLPFYDDIGLQNHRKDYAFGQVYPLIVHRNIILPFQVIISDNIAHIQDIYLTAFDNSSNISIFRSLQENGFTFINYEGFTLIKYPGELPILELEQEGQYYIRIMYSHKITGATKFLFSDVFTSVNRIDDYLLIEYRNSYNFELKNGLIDFSEGFRFKCYLNTQIGKPDYVFEEEATERVGYQFIESQVSKKVYKFTFLAPEYLCDALRLVRLCENKRIVSKGQEYDLTTFNMEPEWQDQGDLAAVECEFETDTVIANIGGYEPVPLGGDYNTDFNTDFIIN